MQKFQSSVFVFAVLAVVPLCSSHIGGQSLFQDLTPHVYCGRHLARALAVLCYDGLPSEKRSDPGTMYGNVLTPYYKSQESHDNWPWMSSHRAMSMGPRRGKRLVVEECCDKPCTVNELITYC